MSVYQRISLAWAIITGRRGYSVFQCNGCQTAKMLHCTMDQSELYATGRTAIKTMLKTDAAMNIIMAVGVENAAAEIMKLAPLMKGPVITDPKDIN